MTVLVIGANGRVGRQLCAMAAEAGVDVRAMVRHRVEAPALEEQGVQTVAGDLEGDFRDAMAGCDEVVFAAGSGSHTGPDRTLMVDLNGAIRAIELAEEMGMRRFIMLSALRAAEPLTAPERLRPYMAAKYAADLVLARSTALDHVILAPGRFTDDEASGLVSTDVGQHHDVTVSRGNVARALLALVQRPELTGRRFALMDGDTPVTEAFP